MMARKKRVEGGERAEIVTEMPGETKRRWRKIPWWLPAIALILVVLVGFAYTQGWLFVARVNGEFVTRLELARRLEEAYGKSALQNLIVEKLINQEARKKAVSIGGDELNKRMEEIVKQVPGGDLEQALSLQGLTRQQFEQQIRVNLVVEKLVETNIKIAEEDIDEYIETNKEMLDIKAEGIRDQVRERLRQEKLYEEASKLIKSLQEAAQISNFL